MTCPLPATVTRRAAGAAGPGPAGGRAAAPWTDVAEALGLSLQALVANKLRAFLTMLGIIIGVAAVIVMVALGQGVANATQESIRKLGTNVLSVWPTPNSQRAV